MAFEVHVQTTFFQPLPLTRYSKATVEGQQPNTKLPNKFLKTKSSIKRGLNRRELAFIIGLYRIQWGFFSFKSINIVGL